MDPAAANLPRFEDLRAAAARLRGVAVHTPLLHVPALDAATGGRMLVKAETLQHTGSFKFRGAYNALALLGPEGRRAGVVACSSGNHAQGIAAAAALFAVPATIVMPADAPPMKIARTRDLGARVVLYDRVSEDRDAIAQGIVAREGGVFVAPFDDPRVIAGQGTVGIEIAAQANDLGVRPDAILVPCSGGGLTAGIALAAEALLPDTRVYTAEPAGFDDHVRSFASGRRESNARMGGSLCDALLAPMPGELTFAVNRPRVAGGVCAEDTEALAAMEFAWRELKLVVEPGGAVALAAILCGRIETRGRTVVAVLSGGNADREVFARALEITRTEATSAPRPA